MEAIRQILTDGLAAAAAQQPRQALPPEADQRPPDRRDSEVGFFHPDLGATYGNGEAVTIGSDTVFRDVHLFIDRLSDAVAFRGAAMVKERIPALLRGTAQMWFSTGLDQVAKTGLRHSSLEVRFTTLRDQFRRPLSEAIQSLSASRYTLHDARAHR